MTKSFLCKIILLDSAKLTMNLKQYSNIQRQLINIIPATGTETMI